MQTFIRLGVLSLWVGLAAARAAEPPSSNRAVRVLFNNAYAALYEDNEAITRNDPEGTARYLFAFIAGATATLDVCVYSINEEAVAEALVAASRRGVAVRVVTDSDNLVVEPGFPALRPAIVALRSEGIPIVEDAQRPFMHHKFMVADGRQVWLGSMNFTPGALYRDNNNSLWITSPKLAANYRTEFERMFAEGLFNSMRHPQPFPILKLDGERARMLFSPSGGIQEAIVDAVRRAKRTVRVMAFTFTDREMAEALARAHERGVEVKVIIEGCQVDVHSAFRFLADRKVPVRRDGNQALMHHKIVVVDDRVVITGSFNFTKAAEQRNNESLLFLESPAIAAQYEGEFQRLWKGAHAHRNLPPYDHPACRRGPAPPT